MNKEDKISVIVPVYNVEQYLEKCLRSIITSTYKNLEIILIDDGSTDKSSEICDRFAVLDERICVVHKPNRGISVARNLGLDMAGGEYIVFVDSDDYISDNMIEVLHKAIKENEADYVVCGFWTVTDTHNFIKEYIPEERICSGTEALVMHYEAKECSPNYVAPWAKMYKSKVWGNIRFVENICFEDIEVMPKVLLNSKKVVIINNLGYYYVQHEGSTMHNLKLREKMYKDSIYIFERHIDLYSKEGLVRLKNAEIQLLLDKIITHDLHNSIPSEYVSLSKRVYRKNFMKLLGTKMNIKKYIKYFVYALLGKKAYAKLRR